MYATVLTVSMRETFNAIANRDMEAENIRMMFNQEQWLSDETEVFWITTQQKDYLLSVWDIINPM